MVALLAAAATAGLLLVSGLGLAVFYAVHPATGTRPDAAKATAGTPSAGAARPIRAAAAAPDADLRDALAAQPMPAVPESASYPAAVSLVDPGRPLLLPRGPRNGPAGVRTGFPRTPAGAMAQLAGLDQTALGSASLAGARAVIAAWALPGGPTTSSWFGVAVVGSLVDAAAQAQGAPPAQLTVVATPLMGLVKGTVGPGFVVPCLDFEVDVTVQQTSRGAVADCQRMTWVGNR